ncbi:hypothetical protein Bca52824_072963 [Brassica carinata]|uniref:Translation elongation factor EF1B beta/delta subunit guanine nucleotide exchange domain-containing protein n=1 Tax=Brassica carinata TaxID=52824 RepID=A0A8X7QEG1_BRACI|nr:hypothetical protein Bca52824_072963 [Brassica carinata]
MCTIVDDLVSVDTMIEEQLTVEPINEFVQSCDIVAFNKISAFPNLSSDCGPKKLDEHLLTRSYLTGCQASKDDLTIFVALAKPPSSQYLNASRWYNHIVALMRTS